MFEKANTDPRDYIDTSNSIPLTFGQSFARGIGSNLLAPAAVSDLINSSLAGKPGEGKTLELLKMWESEQRNPDSSTFGFVLGDLVGFAINPLTYIGGGAIASPVKAAAVKLGINETSSAAARFAAKGALLGSEFSGQLLPQHIVNSFDVEENRLDTLGLAKQVGIDFGMGVAFAGIPFAFGFIRSKFGKPVGTPHAKTSEFTQQSLDEALGSKTISDSEHEFMSTVQRGETPSQELLNRVMSESKIPFDPATGHVNVSLLTPDNLRALHNTVADSLGALMDGETKRALSDYIVKGQLSELIKSPKMIDGLQGVIDHFAERIAKKDTYLSAYDKRIIEPTLRKGLTREASLSQESIYRMIKEGTEDVRGLAIPKQVKEMLRHERDHQALLEGRKVQLQKINELEARLKNPLIEEEGVRFARNKRAAAQEKLADIERDLIASESKRPQLLHPADEMDYLRGTLTGKSLGRELMKDENFARLTDLTNHWSNAKFLHKRVMREHLYDQQTAFKDIAQMLVDLSKNPDQLVGSADNVTDYLKNRIQGKVKKVDTVSRETFYKNSETNIDDLERFAKTDETKDTIMNSRKKLADLEKKEALERFIACVRGV